MSNQAENRNKIQEYCLRGIRVMTEGTLMRELMGGEITYTKGSYNNLLV